jgi:hypothetical protein
MSGELTEHEIHRLCSELDATIRHAQELGELAADKLRGHIAWQAGQIAERDAEIDRLGDVIVSLQESFDAVSSQEDR